MKLELTRLNDALGNPSKDLTLIFKDDNNYIQEIAEGSLSFLAEIAEGHGLSLPNSEDNPCYDCGSTIAGHHTSLCDFAEAGDILDLPHAEGCQHWTGELPL